MSEMGAGFAIGSDDEYGDSNIGGMGGALNYEDFLDDDEIAAFESGDIYPNTESSEALSETIEVTESVEVRESVQVTESVESTEDGVEVEVSTTTRTTTKSTLGASVVVDDSVDSLEDDADLRGDRSEPLR